MIKKIILGTVQFGQKYGIANAVGRIPREAVYKILDYAFAQGIDTLDTAYAYGESEEVIGEFMLQSGKKFRLISKLPDIRSADANALEYYFRDSRKRLGIEKLYGYLVHEFQNLSTVPLLWEQLESLRRRGLVEKIGVSLYHPQEVEYLLEKDYPLNIIQLPYNIFDQRCAKYFSLLKKKKIEIHTRSVFLQGLFFLEEKRIKRDFAAARGALENLRQLSSECNIPVYALCLGFVLLNPYVDKVLIGVDSPGQLRNNVQALTYANSVKRLISLLEALAINDEEIILPTHWK